MQRRTILFSGLSGGLAALTACAGDGTAPPRPSLAGGLLLPGRVVAGGFLAPAPAAGQPPAVARPGSGMFVRLLSPAAIALRGPDLLVADAGTGRLWRIDPAFNQAAGVTGAPVIPGGAVALGPDLSAWVLDPAARQVLRFARDGRLLQTWRVGADVPSPVALALADGGATLLLADGLGAQWSEQRGPGGLARLVAPARDGRRLSGVDAIVPMGDTLLVLDRLAAAVHRVDRDGRVLATLGRGDLVQPGAIAADRDGRVFVADRAGSVLVVLQDGQPARRIDAAALDLLRIGSLAVDERVLALADPMRGQVSLFTLAPGGGS